MVPLSVLPLIVGPFGVVFSLVITVPAGGTPVIGKTRGVVGAGGGGGCWPKTAPGRNTIPKTIVSATDEKSVLIQPPQGSDVRAVFSALSEEAAPLAHRASPCH